MAKQTIRFGVIGCGLMGARVRQRRRALVPPARHGRSAADRGASPTPSWPAWTGSRDNMCDIATGGHRLPRAAGATPRSTRSTAPCRTICTRRSTATSSAPASTCWARSRSASTWRPTSRSWPRIARASAGLRCAARRSFPSSPARTRSASASQEGRFGKIIEVEAGFWHSQRPRPAASRSTGKAHGRSSTASTAAWATWGCTSLHIPLRFGWLPAQRARRCCRRSSPSGPTARAAWRRARRGTTPSWRARCRPPASTSRCCSRTKRIAPGETNTWFIQHPRHASSRPSSPRSTRRRCAR